MLVNKQTMILRTIYNDNINVKCFSVFIAMLFTVLKHLWWDGDLHVMIDWMVCAVL